MSSSKVFKEDQLFTRTTLIRRSMATIPDEPAAVVDEQLAPVQTDAEEAVPLQTQREEPPQPQAEVSAEDKPLKSEVPDPPPAPAVDVEAVRRQAYEQGMADLAAQYQEEMRQAVAAFTDGCHQLSRQRTVLLQQHQTQYINLIMLLCEKIVRQELQTPRNTIAAALQSALEEAIACEEYHVTLHPKDLAIAEQKAPEMVAAVRGIERVVFKTDETITRGGCLLESQVCTVDATVETQLAGLKEFVVEQALVPPLEPDQETPTRSSQPDQVENSSPSAN